VLQTFEQQSPSELQNAPVGPQQVQPSGAGAQWEASPSGVMQESGLQDAG
jgi:hypothetical protein